MKIQRKRKEKKQLENSIKEIKKLLEGIEFIETINPNEEIDLSITNINPEVIDRNISSKKLLDTDLYKMTKQILKMLNIIKESRTLNEYDIHEFIMARDRISLMILKNVFNYKEIDNEFKLYYQYKIQDSLLSSININYNTMCSTERYAVRKRSGKNIKRNRIYLNLVVEEIEKIQETRSVRFEEKEFNGSIS